LNSLDSNAPTAVISGALVALGMLHRRQRLRAPEIQFQVNVNEGCVYQWPQVRTGH
jgi:hypothetical protein